MSVFSSLLLACIFSADLPVSPEPLSGSQGAAEHKMADAPHEGAAQPDPGFALSPRELRFAASEAPEAPQAPEAPGTKPGSQRGPLVEAPSQEQKKPNSGENKPQPSQPQPSQPNPSEQDPRKVKPPSPRYDSKTPPPPRYHSDQQGFDRRRGRRPSSQRGGRSRASHSRGRNEYRTSRSSRSYDSRGRHYDSRSESERVNRQYRNNRGEYRNDSRRGGVSRQNPRAAQQASYRRNSSSQRQQQIRVRQGGPGAQGRPARVDRPHMVELGYGPYGGWWGGEISYLYHLQGGSEGPAVGAIVSGASIGGTSSFSLGGKFQWDFNVMEEEKLDFFAAPFAGVSYQWASTLRSDVGVTVRAVFEDRWVVFIQPAVLSLYTYVGGGEVAERFLPVYHGAAGVGVLF